MKYLNNSKNKRFTLLEPSSVPTNVMIAVTVERSLTSKLHLGAEIEIGPLGWLATRKISITQKASDLRF